MVLTDTLAATTVQTIPVLALALIIEYRVVLQRDMERRKDWQSHRRRTLSRLRQINETLRVVGSPENWPKDSDRERIRKHVIQLAGEAKKIKADYRSRRLSLGRQMLIVLTAYLYGIVAVLDGLAMIVCVVVMAGGGPSVAGANVVVTAFVSSTILLVLAPFVSGYTNLIKSFRDKVGDQ